MSSKGVILPCIDYSTCQTEGKHLQPLKQGYGILNFWQQSPSHSSPSQHKLN